MKVIKVLVLMTLFASCTSNRVLQVEPISGELYELEFVADSEYGPQLIIVNKVNK